MSVVDWGPFLVVFLVAAAAGILFTGIVAWAIAVFLPIAHFILSIATGRANEDFLNYVVPVNLVLLAIAVIGVLGGHWLRNRQLNR